MSGPAGAIIGTHPLLHFALGAGGALIVFLLCARRAGVERFSLPSAVFVVGIVCAVLAHFLSPWATPVVLALYAGASVRELRQDRAALEALRRAGRS